MLEGRTPVTRILLLLSLLAGAAAPTPTPTPAWAKEPSAYRGVAFGTPYADFPGRLLLTGCHPSTTDHEPGQRTCESNGFQANGVAVEDVLFFQNDLFVGVSMSFESDDYEKLREVFVTKFGEPTHLETTRLSSRSGARFDNETMGWDGRKVAVSIERYGETLEKGSATMFLNSYLEQQEKERQERLKKDADSF